jgi:hypothetical protein
VPRDHDGNPGGGEDAGRVDDRRRRELVRPGAVSLFPLTAVTGASAVRTSGLPTSPLG